MGCWGFRRKNSNVQYQAAFDLEYSDELKYQKEILISGLKLFEDIHGYKAQFFVPPNGPINNSLEEVSARMGIKYMSASKIQNEVFGDGKIKKRFHYLGQRNDHQQIYLTRNCFFEPSQVGKDWVDSCLSDINYTFRWKKPAVISTHRVNYIGSLVEKNRDNGLKQLNKLLGEILKYWPDVEFMTSVELGEIISEDNE